MARIINATISVLLILGVILADVAGIGSPGFGPVQFILLLLGLILLCASILFNDRELLREFAVKNVKLFVTLTSLVFTCFVAEVVARAYVDQTTVGQQILGKTGERIEPYDNPGDYYGKYDVAAKMQYNTFLGYIPAPSTRGNGYVTNSTHFRYPHDFPVKKGEKEIRIFVTGGSTAWGAGANQEQLYTTIFEKGLREKYSNSTTRVISAAAGSYTSTQERIMIENYVYQYEPDLIVMLTGWNDIFFGYRGDNVLQVQDVMGYKSMVDRFTKSVFEKITPPESRHYTFKLAYLIDTAFYRLKHRNREEMENLIKRNAVPPQSVYDRFLHNVTIISDLASRKKWDFAVCLQPTIYDTRHRMSSADSLDSGVGFLGYHRKIYKIYRQRLPKDMAKLGITYLDCDDAIADEPKPVFTDSAHFGDRGNRLIGEFLARRLLPLIDQRIIQNKNSRR